MAIRDGRTSTEVLRRTEVDEAGQESLVAREYAMLDRAGRLQLPDEYTTALGMADRVLLELEEDHIQVWPDRNGSENGRRPGHAAPARSSGRGLWGRRHLGGLGRSPQISRPYAFVRDVLGVRVRPSAHGPSGGSGPAAR
ncbi:hypothetical protein SPURM210S_03370 [Streptomyces purpurascens]